MLEVDVQTEADWQRKDSDRQELLVPGHQRRRVHEVVLRGVRMRQSGGVRCVSRFDLGPMCNR